MPTGFDPASTFDDLETQDTQPGRTTAVDEVPPWASPSFDPVDHGGDWLTATLPVPAIHAFDCFADLEALPAWLPIIRRVHVHRRDGLDRPTLVSFLAGLDRGTIGYSLRYDYQPEVLGIRWSTPADTNLRVSGWVRFASLGPAACLMEYQLRVDRDGLPSWRDPVFDQHAPSAVLCHFREYIRAAENQV